MRLATGAASLLPEPEAYEQRALGFWLYLMSDAIIFALLFATYLVMVDNTAGGPGGQSLFHLAHTFGETLLLLTSSLTFGLASLALDAGSRSKVIAWLAVTFLFGLGFLAMELFEFRDMLAVGAGPQRSGFLSAFFTLVGTHGLHVSAGLLFILVMICQVAVKGLAAPVASRLLRLGFFWHFLDIVWIGIFSVVYLPALL
ncbi:cytochrome bo3 quinol oxidase subunit 3 [Microbulbifer donghaiensis]|uniref:Cytochrome bo(3) ubiquinol oxidase subunit 3 n=1 Tax=Microbulbifer donghaiensis TaxID=494016 RepID=A0A1M4VUL5_9GAMM|nr:cytochrome o ubiquinol oxidase subunit III [Microbulbifer donghaiensis]SHE72607.1 cytochrome bo3 quinol oxidase subunit 3 [Microbulbifer donghaiensis]